MNRNLKTIRNLGRLGLLAAVIVAVTVPSVVTAHSANPAPKGNKNAPGQLQTTSFDPTYNVCRGTDPRCYNDFGRQDARADRVLIYSRTAGPRHQKLGTRLEGLGLNPPLNPDNVAQARLIELLADEGIQADWTEDVNRMFNLNAYKAVIFLSTSRDTLWDHAGALAGGTRLDRGRETLKKYIEAGGGFVAIHNAFGTEYGWPWYEGLLGNANFYEHGSHQDATFEIIADDSSTTGAGLPLGTRVAFKDEWYNLIPFPNNVKFLAVVDSSTMLRGLGEPEHKEFHPISWCQYYDGGRAWVTTMGHDVAAFRVDDGTFPGAAAFQAHILEGIKSAMGLVPFCE